MSATPNHTSSSQQGPRPSTRKETAGRQTVTIESLPGELVHRTLSYLDRSELYKLAGLSETAEWPWLNCHVMETLYGYGHMVDISVKTIERHMEEYFHPIDPKAKKDQYTPKPDPRNPEELLVSRILGLSYTGRIFSSNTAEQIKQLLSHTPSVLDQLVYHTSSFHVNNRLWSTNIIQRKREDGTDIEIPIGVSRKAKHITLDFSDTERMEYVSRFAFSKFRDTLMGDHLSVICHSDFFPIFVGFNTSSEADPTAAYKDISIWCVPASDGDEENSPPTSVGNRVKEIAEDFVSELGNYCHTSVRVIDALGRDATKSDYEKLTCVGRKMYEHRMKGQAGDSRSAVDYGKRFDELFTFHGGNDNAVPVPVDSAEAGWDNDAVIQS